MALSVGGLEASLGVPEVIVGEVVPSEVVKESYTLGGGVEAQRGRVLCYVREKLVREP